MSVAVSWVTCVTIVSLICTMNKNVCAIHNKHPYSTKPLYGIDNVLIVQGVQGVPKKSDTIEMILLLLNRS